MLIVLGRQITLKDRKLSQMKTLYNLYQLISAYMFSTVMYFFNLVPVAVYTCPHSTLQIPGFALRTPVATSMATHEHAFCTLSTCSMDWKIFPLRASLSGPIW